MQTRIRFPERPKGHNSRPRRLAATSIIAAIASVGLASPAMAVSDTSVNPLTAYGEWNVVAFGDVHLSAESEGPVAARGAFSFTNSNVALHTATTTDGVGLLAGEVDLASSTGVLRVLSKGEIRVEDLSTATVLGVDANGATVATRVVAAGSSYDSNPAIALDHQQAAGTIPAQGMFASLFDVAAAASASETVNQASIAASNQSKTVAATVQGASAVLTLSGGDNYWNVTAEELGQIRSVTFSGTAPSPENPLIVNISGTTPLTLQLTMSGARDPGGILFTAPDVTEITQKR